ncbi:MAG: hypothetical protein HYS27_01635 [Deltaproteobacteria bacterium]|nr:hypothetical protein [Deltaproteobacteria bacterium]
MRLSPLPLALGLVVAALPARADATACTADAQCVVASGQVCRLSTSTCVFQVLDGDTFNDDLRAAMVAANADAAADVIVLGDANAAVDAGSDNIFRQFGSNGFTDPLLGAFTLPIVIAPLTIEAGSITSVTFDGTDAVRFFLVKNDVTLDVQASLTLKDLTMVNAASPVAGGSVIHVDGTPTTTGLVPALTLQDVAIRGSAGGSAPIVSHGDAPRLTNCSSRWNSGDVAGLLVVDRGAVISGGSFADSRGVTGAVEATAATFVDATAATVDAVLAINGATFDGNVGETAGAVRSLATTNLGACTFTNNRATETGAQGGAVLARNLRIIGGAYRDNYANGGGGAVALLDAPESVAAYVSGAVFARNSTNGNGGALLASVVPVAVVDSFFDDNEARLRGGGMHVENTAERNGTSPQLNIQRTAFRSNLTRPTLALVSSETTLDELGADEGAIVISALGNGSALSIATVTDVDVSQSCFRGNGAPAVYASATNDVTVTSTWWGAATGPAPDGDGDLITGISVASPATTPTAPCEDDPEGGYPQLFVDAQVSATSAQVVTDYDVLLESNGARVFNGVAGTMPANTQKGQTSLRVVGVNDADVEGAETFTFQTVACSGADCGYNLGSAVNLTFTITDNGTGAGEGEGEGEECVENVTVAPTSLVLPNTGAAVEDVLNITNGSSCAVQLIRPLVQAGASQGFGVKPVPQDALALDPGEALTISVTFTPPEEETGEEAVGTLVIQTQGGTLLQVALSLEQGCACSSTGRGAPFTALLTLAAAGATAAARRRRKGAVGS